MGNAHAFDYRYDDPPIGYVFYVASTIREQRPCHPPREGESTEPGMNLVLGEVIRIKKKRIYISLSGTEEQHTGIGFKDGEDRYIPRDRTGAQSRYILKYVTAASALDGLLEHLKQQETGYRLDIERLQTIAKLVQKKRESLK